MTDARREQYARIIEPMIASVCSDGNSDSRALSADIADAILALESAEIARLTQELTETDRAGCEAFRLAVHHQDRAEAAELARDAEVEELHRTKSAAIAFWKATAKRFADAHGVALGRVFHSIRALTAAREALEPFAAVAAVHDRDEPDDTTLYSCSARHVVTIGDLRRARAALPKHEAEDV